MKMILAAVKEVWLSFFPNRAMQEALLKYDFRIDDPRQNIMQLCFSALASWPLMLLIGVIYIDPKKYAFTLQRLFGDDSSITFFLLSGQTSAMWSVAVVFFLIEWVFRREYFFIAIIFYFLAKGDLHIHLATAAILATFVSRSFYMWWLHINLESRSRKIWKIATSLQIGGVIFVSFAALFALDYLQRNRYFSGSILANRFEFLSLILISYYVTTTILLSLWGHFYARMRVEPSFLPVYYSTQAWIFAIKMRPYIKTKLLEKVKIVLPEHQKAAAKFEEIKDQSLGLSMNHLVKTLNGEISHLQAASSRLTI